MAHIAVRAGRPRAPRRLHAPLCLEVLAGIRFGGLTTADNCTLADHEVAIASLARYRAAGGQSSSTPPASASAAIPKAPQMPARPGSYIRDGRLVYVGPTHPTAHRVRGSSPDELAERIVAELVAAPTYGIRPGLIARSGARGR